MEIQLESGGGALGLNMRQSDLEALLAKIFTVMTGG